jgi:hypothetical protein
MASQVQEFKAPGIEHDYDELGAHHRKFEEMALRELLSPARASLEGLITPLPRQVLLGALRDGRLRVRSPIAVNITREDHHIIVEALEFDEFGFGNTLSEALVDLQHAIADLYLTLEQEQDHLGPDLERVWHSLQEKIQRRP